MDTDLKLKGIFSKLKKAILREKDVLRGLGVSSSKNKIYLYYRPPHSKGKEFDIAVSEDGFDFMQYAKEVTISSEKVSQISVYENFRFFSEENKKYFLFNRKVRNSSLLSIAEQHDVKDCNHFEDIKDIKEGIVVPEFRYKNNYVMYTAGFSLGLAYSPDLKQWNLQTEDVLNIGTGHTVEPLYAFPTEKGILVFYLVNEESVEVALLNRDNPYNLVWRHTRSFWIKRKEWKNKKISHIGTIDFNGKIMSYWTVEEVGIFVVVYPLSQLPPVTGIHSVSLLKSQKNPIIAPRAKNKWEAFNTFNPAAIHEGGKVHIIYRAQGYDYVSSIGLATSKDGIHIDERYDEPIYSPQQLFDFVTKDKKKISYQFMSGGGFGGCEDPRVTKIDDRLYMTYVAFDGVTPPRLALTSINIDDFLNRRWMWEKPVLISPPGIVDKSGCLFPEKIHGKYVFMHRVFPNILIDFVDDLNFDGTKWLKGQYQIKIREKMWDSRKIGAGAPPLKTKDGWLLIYYAVDDKDASKYKVGAMLLDLKNPTKVLHRTNRPILEPDAFYENQGFKPGVAYPCGAVIMNGTLFVYYGGADSVVCVATAPLDAFLNDLKLHEAAHLEPAKIQKIPYEC